MKRTIVLERRPAKQVTIAPRPRPIARGSGLLALAWSMHTEQPRQPIATSAAGRRHMARVAAMGCLICRHLGYGQVAAEVHHIRGPAGAGERSSDWLTVPLCETHHRRDGTGFHGVGARAFERRYGIDEYGLLAEVIARLAGPGTEKGAA